MWAPGGPWGGGWGATASHISPRYSYLAEGAIPLDARRIRWLAGGVFFVALGAYFLATAGGVQSGDRTFDLIPGKGYSVPFNLANQATIQGDFRETSGSPVRFYVMSSVQYASLETGQGIGSLYNLPATDSSTFSFTATAQDTYYLIFFHGSGLANTTETVRLHWSLGALNQTRLFTGIGFLGISSVDFFLAFRRRPTDPARSEAQPGPGAVETGALDQQEP